MTSQSKIYHWTDIQTPNFRIKPTLVMLYLGEVLELSALLKGEPRGEGRREIRRFLFDKEYCYEFFKRNIFFPTDNLTPKQFLTIFLEFYSRYLTNIKRVEPIEDHFLGEKGFRIYKLHGKRVIVIDELLDENEAK